MAEQLIETTRLDLIHGGGIKKSSPLWTMEHNIVDPSDDSYRTRLLMEYQAQLTGYSPEKAMINDKKQEELLRNLQILPEEALKAPFPPKQTNLFSILRETIKYKKAGQNGAETRAPQAQVDECWRRLLKCYVIACQAAQKEKKPIDLLLTEMLNHIHEAGVTDRLQDETEEVLMAATITHPRRFEIFDACYRFMKKRNHLEKFLELMRKNPSLAVTIPEDYSDAIEELSKDVTTEDGTPAILELRRLRYMARPSDERYATPYCYRYCISHRGDFTEAKRAANRISNPQIRRAILKDIQENLIPVADGILEASEASPEDKKVEKEAQGNPDMIRKDTQRQTKELQITRLLVKLQSCTSEESIEILHEIETLQVFAMQIQLALSIFFRQKIIDQKDPKERAKTIEAFVKAEFRIAQDMMNDLITLLVEAYFEQELYKETIGTWETYSKKFPATTELRAVTYYLLKSCARAFPGDEKKLKPYLETAAKQLPQFAGTKWEKELLGDYLLPRYKEYQTIIEPSETVLATAEELYKQRPDDIKALYAVVHIAFKKDKLSPEHKARLIKLNQELQNPQELDVINRKLINTLKQRGDFKSAAEIIRSIKDFEKSEFYVEQLCICLLHPSDLTKETYEEAQKILASHQGIREKLAVQLETARIRLNIIKTVELDSTRYIEIIIKDELSNRKICPKELSHAGFAIEQLQALAATYRQTLTEEMASNPQNTLLNTGTIEREFTSPNKLAEIFGITKIRFQRSKSGNFTVTLILKDRTEKAKVLTSTETKFEMDKDFNIDIQTPATSTINRIPVRLVIMTLKTFIVEELYNAVTDDSLSETEEILDPHNEKFRKFKTWLKKELQKIPELAEYKGLEGLAERNTKAVSILEEKLRKSSVEFPPQEETASFIARYLTIIKTCRDLDDPSMLYKSGISNENPLAETGLKYAKLFNSEYAAEKLEREMEIKKEALASLGIPKTSPNNFQGYYELVCFSPETGEIPISIFLDQNGIPHIPGIDKNHQLHNMLWMTLLESMIAKLVPELGPYTHVFLRKKRKEEETKHRTPPPPEKESSITQRKRHYCAALLREPQGEDGEKLKKLEEICQIFNIVELSTKTLDEWPLVLKVDDEYVRVSGLFEMDKKTRTNKVNIKKLKEILPQELQIIATAEIPDNQPQIEVTNLPQEIQQFLQKKLRVQTLSGRQIRLPIDWKYLQHEIELGTDGREYLLVPAKHKTRNTVKKGGKLYKKEDLKPHTKIQIGDDTFLAIPRKMSGTSEKRYRESERIGIELKFDQQPSWYAVLYNPESKTIEAYKYLGPADREDLNVSRYLALHERGIPILKELPEIKEEFEETDKFKEAVFQVSSNRGYMWGRSSPLWKYLQDPNIDMSTVAANLLADLIKKKIKSAEYSQFLEELRQEESKKAPKPKRTKRRKIIPPPEEKTEQPIPPRSPQKPSARQTREAAERGIILDPSIPYRVNQKYEKEYAGIADFPLWYIPPTHPQYPHFKDSLEPEKDEVIIAPKNRNGLPTKIKKEALEPITR